MKLMKKLWSNTKGAEYVEVILVCSVLALGGVVAWQAFGGRIADKLNSAGESVNAIPEAWSGGGGGGGGEGGGGAP